MNWGGYNLVKKRNYIYDDLKRILAIQPAIKVPTVSESDNVRFVKYFFVVKYSEYFKGKYITRNLRGLGHNLPQETPKKFALAIIKTS